MTYYGDTMRKIGVAKIKKVVSELCIEANTVLRNDILSALKKAVKAEKNSKAKKVLRLLIENAEIARREKLAICQDTGMACVYLEIGQDVKIAGGPLEKAVTDGVKDGYRKGYFRNSVVDPLSRKNTKNNAPAVIHTKIVNGSKMSVTVSPKGFGSENKNKIKMFKPTVDVKEIIKFVVDCVIEAGPSACPPFIVGVGIGGTFEKAAELSKEALLRRVDSRSSLVVSRLEKDLLRKINSLNIGPAGLGGKTTALAVNILTYPTHIAGLPVAVSVGCHAMRSAGRVI